MHPLQLKLDAAHALDESDEPDEPGRVNNTDIVEEYLCDEVPLKNTSHLMFVALTHPFIRLPVHPGRCPSPSAHGPSGSSALLQCVSSPALFSTFY